MHSGILNDKACKVHTVLLQNNVTLTKKCIKAGMMLDLKQDSSLKRLYSGLSYLIHIFDIWKAMAVWGMDIQKCEKKYMVCIRKWLAVSAWLKHDGDGFEVRIGSTKEY